MNPIFILFANNTHQVSESIRLVRSHQREFQTFNPRTLKIGKKQKETVPDCIATKSHSFRVNAMGEATEYRGDYAMGLRVMRDEDREGLALFDERLAKLNAELDAVKKLRREYLAQCYAVARKANRDDALAFENQPAKV